MRIHGTFEVKLTPQPGGDAADGVQMGQSALDKRFSGELDATSKGSMLSALGTQPGSAGYVALERVTGSLSGKRGSFVLQHFGVMDRGAQQLTISVVPDSGTGELSGLRGRMTIEIKGGTHFYDFEYDH